MKKKLLGFILLAAVISMLSTGCEAPHKALPTPPSPPAHPAP